MAALEVAVWRLPRGSVDARDWCWVISIPVFLNGVLINPADPAIAPWVESFIDECSSFPNGKYDDQVDQMTQVLNRLRGAVAPPVYRPPPPPSGERSWMK